MGQRCGADMGSDGVRVDSATTVAIHAADAQHAVIFKRVKQFVFEQFFIWWHAFQWLRVFFGFAVLGYAFAEYAVVFKRR